MVWLVVLAMGRPRWGIALGGVLASMLVGCDASEIFSCQDSDQCGVTGVCERAVGFCSFPDRACETTERRYDEFAGEGLANVCVPAPGVAADSTAEASDEGGPSSDGGVTTSGPSDPDSATDGGPSIESTATTEGGLESAPSADGIDPDSTGGISGGESPIDEGQIPSDVTGTDGGTVDPGPPCFVNNLSDNIVDSYWRPPLLAVGTALAEVGGAVVLSLSTNPAFVALESEELKLRLNTQVRLEVLEIPERTAPNSQLLFGVGNGVERVIFEVTQGTLSARTDLSDGVGGVIYDRQGARPFDDILHRFLQVTIAGGTVTWETSPDGVTFVPFVASVPIPAFLGLQATRTQILAGTFAFQNDPPGTGQARFESFQDCVLAP